MALLFINSLSSHLQCLKKLCRLCGKKHQTYAEQSTGKTSYRASAFSKKILEVYGIDVTEDREDVHPVHICKACYLKCSDKKKRIAYEWEAHPESEEDECQVCNHYKQIAKGGRPQKPLVGKAVKSELVMTSNHHFASLIDTNATPISLQGFSLTCPVHKCPICGEFLTNPVETGCKHIFCLKCIRAQFKDTNIIKCTVCKDEVHFLTIQQASIYFQQSLGFAYLECNNCKTKVPLSEKDSHKCTTSPSLRTILKCSLLTSEPNDALTPRTERIGTTILKRKLAQSKDGITASFKTGGQVNLNEDRGILQFSLTIYVKIKITS